MAENEFIKSPKNESPEGRELRKKQEILQELEEKLANKELELISLQSTLQSFQDIYLRQVGIKIAELDELQLKINQLLLRQQPTNEHIKKATRDSHRRAEQSQFAKDYTEKNIAHKKVKPSEETKNLYRKIAKICHPDLAENEEDRALRTEFMKKINAAYMEGNTQALKDLLSEWESGPDQIQGDGIGEMLIRAIRKIELITKSLTALEINIQTLMSSDYYKLMLEYENVLALGGNLLEDMEKYYDEQIRIKQIEYEQLKRNMSDGR